MRNGNFVITKPKRKMAIDTKEFPELRAVAERMFKEVWRNEDDKLWQSYLKD